jgi:uncharacterized membrane protein
VTRVMAGDKVTSAVTSALPSVAKSLAGAMGKKVLSSATQRLGDTAQRLTDFTANGGGPGGLLGALTGRGGGGSAKGKSLKVTNIVEHIDVGAPLRLVYDQWTRFTDFPSFMKKVENVEQVEDDQLEWKAQIFWSHRTWKSTIIEQVPDKCIVWQSEGQKGSVDGAVTFHELGPGLTRILLVLQYHPQGFFERTGNLWRAQGRRARLELKHFARHVMNDAILHADDVQGWRGEIHDGEVTAPEDVEAPREEQRQERGEDRDGGRPRDRGPRPEGRERELRPSRSGPESRPPRDEEAGGRRRRPSEDDRRPVRSVRDR